MLLSTGAIQAHGAKAAGKCHGMLQKGTHGSKELKCTYVMGSQAQPATSEPMVSFLGNLLCLV